MSRDYTQYAFEGETYGKGRLVLALVRRFTSEHPSITFDELRMTFPDGLQAECSTQFSEVRCVVGRVTDLSEVARRRFFVEEWLQLADGKAVVSREWNVENIRNMLARAEQLGYQVTILDSA